MKRRKLSRFGFFCACWTVGALSYLSDCLIVSTFDHPPDVPWLERGMYSGIGIIFTIGCFVAPIFEAISDRIGDRDQERR